MIVIVASNLSSHLDSENHFLRYELERQRSLCQQQKVGKFKNSIHSYIRLSRTRTLPSLLCCWVWGTTIMISKPTVWFFLDHWSLRKCDFLYNSIFHIPYILICHCVMHDAHLIYWRNCFFSSPRQPLYGYYTAGQYCPSNKKCCKDWVTLLIHTSGGSKNTPKIRPHTAAHEAG